MYDAPIASLDLARKDAVNVLDSVIKDIEMLRRRLASQEEAKQAGEKIIMDFEMALDRLRKASAAS